MDVAKSAGLWAILALLTLIFLRKGVGSVRFS